MSHLNLEFETIEVDILQGESRTQDFLTKNPIGRVPTLQLLDGRFLAESNTILWFLAKDSPLFPTDAYNQALVFQWMGFEQYSHEPFIATSRFWISILKQPDKYAVQISEKQLPGYAALDLMERHLADSDFFVGNEFSIADISLYAYTHVAHEGGFNLARYPSINAWLKRIQALPSHIGISA